MFKIRISKHPPKKYLKIIKVVFYLFIFITLLGISVFIYYAKDLPRPEKFTERQIIQPTKIYDRTGKFLLYTIYGEENREIVSLDQIPLQLREAVISTEDADFYRHAFGLDLKGIIRAIANDIKIGKPIEGGSTITQQLIRSTFLTNKKTAERKIREIVLTIELSRRYPKDTILEWYLNQIPFGPNIYGVQEASKRYFGKQVSQLNLPESAVLAALIRAPSYLSPYGRNKDKLMARKNYVLDRMTKEGYITPQEAEKNKKEEITFKEREYHILAPHFINYVKDKLIREYGFDYLETNGLKVYTTLDYNLQKLAEDDVKKWSKINEKYHAFNESLVALDPNNGDILAMVGSKDYYGKSYPDGCTSGVNCLFDPKVNVALYGKGRQPGSAFKPFAYATAFRKGYIPQTVLWDVKTEFNPSCSWDGTQKKSIYGNDCYHPRNYDGKFRGAVTLRSALAQSLNVPSVITLYLAGIKDTIDTAHLLGITTLNKNPEYYGLPLVLGGGEVKLLDMVSAYGVFATRGIKFYPSTILKIEDSSGNIIEENKQEGRVVLNKQTCSYINDVLSDNEARAPMFGWHSKLFIAGHRVAVKTGSTNSFKDAWTIGYTPSIVVGVWVGNNNHASALQEPGVVLAGPTWNEFMLSALKKYPPENEFQKTRSPKINKEMVGGNFDWSHPHSILYYVSKNDPLGDIPEKKDAQFLNWEKGVQVWIKYNRK